MKKWNWVKRAVTFGLIGSLTVGLCACGGGGKNENAALAKEHVYRVKDIELPKIEGDDWNIHATAHKDGKVYLLMEVYHWREEKEGEENDIRLMSLAEDGSGVEIVKLEMPQWERRVKPDAGGSEVPDTETGTETDPNPDYGVMPLTEPQTGTEGEDDTAPEGNGEEGDTTPEGDGGEGDTTSEGDSVPEDAEGDEAVTVEPEVYVTPNDAWENSYYNNYIFGADGRIHPDPN